MSEAALVDLLERILSGKHDPVAAIIENEKARGFKIVRPGDAPWFRATDWRYTSVASISGIRARLVLIHAFENGKGAMTRTIAGAQVAGLIPVIIDPTKELADTLRRRGWRPKVEGSTFEDRETVWSRTSALSTADTTKVPPC